MLLICIDSKIVSRFEISFTLHANPSFQCKSVFVFVDFVRHQIIGIGIKSCFGPKKILSYSIGLFGIISLVRELFPASYLYAHHHVSVLVQSTKRIIETEALFMMPNLPSNAKAIVWLTPCRWGFQVD